MKKFLVLLIAIVGFGISVNAQVIINQDNKKQTEELENKGCGYSIETHKNSFTGDFIEGWKYSNSCKYKNYKIKVTYKQYKSVFVKASPYGGYGDHYATDFNSTPEVKTKIVYLKPNTKEEIIEMHDCEFVDEECLNCNE